MLSSLLTVLTFEHTDVPAAQKGASHDEILLKEKHIEFTKFLA